MATFTNNNNNNDSNSSSSSSSSNFGAPIVAESNNISSELTSEQPAEEYQQSLVDTNPVASAPSSATGNEQIFNSVFNEFDMNTFKIALSMLDDDSDLSDVSYPRVKLNNASGIFAFKNSTDPTDQDQVEKLKTQLMFISSEQLPNLCDNTKVQELLQGSTPLYLNNPVFGKELVNLIRLSLIKNINKDDTETNRRDNVETFINKRFETARQALSDSQNKTALIKIWSAIIELALNKIIESDADSNIKKLCDLYRKDNSVKYDLKKVTNFPADMTKISSIDNGSLYLVLQSSLSNIINTNSLTININDLMKNINSKVSELGISNISEIFSQENADKLITIAKEGKLLNTTTSATTPTPSPDTSQQTVGGYNQMKQRRSFRREFKRILGKSKKMSRFNKRKHRKTTKKFNHRKLNK